MLQLEYSGKLTVMPHIVDAPRPMAHAIASFDGVEDVYYSALDFWVQADYLRQWSQAIQRMRGRPPVVVIVKSLHPIHTAGFCEAYVGWKRNAKYLFQDRILDVPASFERTPDSPWHELAGEYSAVSSDGDPIIDQWSVNAEDE